MLPQKSVTENGEPAFHFSALLRCSGRNPPRPWKTRSLSGGPGPPLAALNFRLCLCGGGELSQVRSRPAGSLCHQWKCFFFFFCSLPEAIRQRAFCSTFSVQEIRSRVAFDEAPQLAPKKKGGDRILPTRPTPNHPSIFSVKSSHLEDILVPHQQRWPPLRSSGYAANAVMPVS